MRAARLLPMSTLEEAEEALSGGYPRAVVDFTATASIQAEPD